MKYIIVICDAKTFLFDLFKGEDGAAISKLIDDRRSPKLVSTKTFVDDHSLTLIAEGMAICKFRQLSILNAVIVLLSSYYAFNAVYPKGFTGHSKNIFLCLDYTLLGEFNYFKYDTSDCKLHVFFDSTKQFLINSTGNPFIMIIMLKYISSSIL